MLTLEFGEMRERTVRGRIRKESDFAVHIQCPWRIVRDDSMVVGYSDMRCPPTGVSEDAFDPNEQRTMRDELVERFILHGDPAHAVRRAKGSIIGDLRIDLEDGCVVEVFPDLITPSSGGGYEYWRLFVPGDNSSHFVVGPDGIET